MSYKKKYTSIHYTIKILIILNHYPQICINFADSQKTNDINFLFNKKK